MHIKEYLKFILDGNYRKKIRMLEEDGLTEVLRFCNIKNKNIMILRRRNIEVGTFSDYIVFLRFIEESVEKGYIPIIDRKSVKNIFYHASPDINTWESFFEQPFNLSLDDISFDDNVYVHHISSKVFPVSLINCKSDETIGYWRKFAQKYIRFKPDILEILERIKIDIIGNSRVLGVSIREGYTKLGEQDISKIKGHSIQASVEEMLNYADKYLIEWNCEKVFFSCETIETENKFKDRFGTRALCVKRERNSYNSLPITSDLYRKQRNNEYKKELEYITEIYLLSKCNSFIFSENSGSEAAFIMSDGYENFLHINKGTY